MNGSAASAASVALFVAADARVPSPFETPRCLSSWRSREGLVVWFVCCFFPGNEAKRSGGKWKASKRLQARDL